MLIYEIDKDIPSKVSIRKALRRNSSTILKQLWDNDGKVKRVNEIDLSDISGFCNELKGKIGGAFVLYVIFDNKSSKYRMIAVAIDKNFNPFCSDRSKPKAATMYYTVFEAPKLGQVLQQTINVDKDFLCIDDEYKGHFSNLV